MRLSFFQLEAMSGRIHTVYFEHCLAYKIERETQGQRATPFTLILHTKLFDFLDNN